MLSKKITTLAAATLALCGCWQLKTPTAIAQNATIPAPRADQTSFIEGRVYDARTKAPIAGAKVSWEGFDDLFETTTDAQGRYRIAHVVPGAAIDEGYAYSVSAKGYSVRSNYASYEDTVVKVPAGGLRFDFAMLGVSQVSGQVKDGNGHPIQGAHVHVYSEAGDNSEVVATGKDGRWSVGNLQVPFPQGTVVLGVETFDPRFSQVESQVKLSANNESNLTQTLPTRAVISGVLTRRGKPLSGAYVSVNIEEGMGFFNDDSNYGLPASSVSTDKNGRYRLLVSAPKTFVLSLDGEDAVGQQVTVTTRPGQKLVVNRDLKPFPYGSIIGRVTDLSGRPLARSDIELWDNDTSETMPVATTDKAGRFVIKKVAPRDDYHVSVALPGSQYRSNGYSDTFRVRSYQTTRVTVRIDTIVPKVAAPQAPRVISGRVRVRFDASDNVGVWVVEAKLDGQDIIEDHQQLSAYFSENQPRRAQGALEWDSRQFANGRHTFSLVATDRAGNQTSRQWFLWILNKGNPKPHDAAHAPQSPRGPGAPNEVAGY